MEVGQKVKFRFPNEIEMDGREATQRDTQVPGYVIAHQGPCALIRPIGLEEHVDQELPLRYRRVVRHVNNLSVFT